MYQICYIHRTKCEYLSVTMNESNSHVIFSFSFYKTSFRNKSTTGDKRKLKLKSIYYLIYSEIKRLTQNLLITLMKK